MANAIKLGYITSRLAKAAFGYQPEGGPKQRWSIVIDTPMLDMMTKDSPDGCLKALDIFQQALLQSNQQYVSKSVNGKSWIVGEAIVDGRFQKYCFLIRRDETPSATLVIEKAEEYDCDKSDPARDYLEGDKYGEWISIRRFMTQSASYYARKLDE